MPIRSPLAAALLATALVGCYEAPPRKEPKPGVTAESLQGKLRHRALLTARSDFSDPQLRVIQYPEEYDEMWRAGFTNVRGLVKPYVNFDTEMVILVGTGSRPSSGFRIAVDSVVAGSDLAIYVTEHQPRSDCKGLTGIEAPAQIVTIPWMDKPVRFIEAQKPSDFC